MNMEKSNSEGSSPESSLLHKECRDAGDAFLSKWMGDSTWQTCKETMFSEDDNALLVGAGVEFLQKWMGKDNLARWEDLWKTSELTTTGEFVSWMLDVSQSAKEQRSAAEEDASDTSDCLASVDLSVVKCEPHIDSGNLLYEEVGSYKYVATTPSVNTHQPGTEQKLEDEHAESPVTSDFELEHTETSENGSDIENSPKSSLVSEHINDKTQTCQLKKYACDICTFKTAYDRCLKHHQRSIHNLDSTRDIGLTVRLDEVPNKAMGDFCCYVAQDTKNLTVHKTVDHKMGTTKKFGCDLCDFKAACLRDIKSHKICTDGPHSLKDHNYADDNLIGLTGEEKAQQKTYTVSEKNESQCTSGKVEQTRKQEVARTEAAQRYACNMCDYKTSRLRSIKPHKINIHGETSVKNYNCNDYRINVDTTLPKPVPLPKKYACNMCDFTTARLRSIKPHKLNIHGEESVKDYNCDDYRIDFQPRNKMVQLPKKYMCDLCDFKSAYLRGIKPHKIRKHGWDSVRMYNHADHIIKGEMDIQLESGNVISTPNYGCDMCDFKSDNSKDIKPHKRLVHGPNSLKYRRNAARHATAALKQTVKKYVCDICNFNTAYIRGMKTHRIKNHGMDSIKHYNYSDHMSEVHMKKKPRERFACDLCNFKSRYAKEVKSHKIATHGADSVLHYKTSDHKMKADERHPCPMCGKLYYKNYIPLHINVMHMDQKPVREKKFLCSICGYKTCHSGTLTVHMRTHSSTKHLKCNLCNYRTNMKNNLKTHMISMHTQPQNIPCKECGKTFANRLNLYSHIRSVHRPPRNPVICPTCGKVFAKKARLKRHSVIHTGEKRYACDLCNHRCSQYDNLTTHRRLVHKMLVNSPAQPHQ